jgi:hypothetical protein
MINAGKEIGGAEVGLYFDYDMKLLIYPSGNPQLGQPVRRMKPAYAKITRR